MGSVDLRRKKKVILSKKKRQNRRVPVFASVRTKREADNPKRRNWRTQKMKLSKDKIKKM